MQAHRAFFGREGVLVALRLFLWIFFNERAKSARNLYPVRLACRAMCAKVAISRTKTFAYVPCMEHETWPTRTALHRRACSGMCVAAKRCFSALHAFPASLVTVGRSQRMKACKAASYRCHGIDFDGSSHYKSYHILMRLTCSWGHDPNISP